MYKEILINKIKQQSANVGIIGLGYVGLPLSSAFLNIGFKVYGFDIDIKKIKKLNKVKIYIENINSHIFKTNKNKFIVSKINKNIRMILRIITKQSTIKAMKASKARHYFVFM